MPRHRPSDATRQKFGFKPSLNGPRALYALKPVVTPFVVSDGQTFDLIEQALAHAKGVARKAPGFATIVAANGTKIARIENLAVMDEYEYRVRKGARHEEE